MIVAFASLFLGLTLGAHPVSVVVADPVEVVELVLDGHTVGTVTAESSWTMPVDFSAILAPHELEAVAYDGDGKELGRVSQRINLPRPAAEADVVIEGAQEGRRAVARVTWESVEGSEPTTVEARLDGRRLEVTDPRRIALPALDPDQLHFLQVDLEFSDTVAAVAEVTFGGVYGNSTETELTALPVVPVEGAPRLKLADLDGWFANVEGEHLQAVAIEEGPAEAVFVLDGAAQPVLWDIARRLELQRSGPLRGPLKGYSAPPRPGAQVGRPATQLIRGIMKLRKDQFLRLLWPAPQRVEGEEDRPAVELFPRSEEHPPEHGGVLWLLSEAHQPPFALSDQRLVDAVAVAGMTATLRSRRRAVVLVLTERPADSSRFSPANVRRYLEQIGVPLKVWVVGKVSEPMRQVWGDVRPVDAINRFGEAVTDLTRTLEQQRIVWVEGRYLPQEVVVTGRAQVRRAR